MVNIGRDERQYLDMLRELISVGYSTKPAGEEGRYQVFGRTMRFDLTENKLPLLTTKRVHFKSLAVEMLWFLSGSQNIQMLKEHGVTIWDEWANEEGDVGPLYGYQWRHWRGDRDIGGGITEIDQVATVMQSLKDRPEARSHVITAWRPDHLKHMAIKPCHILLQFYRIWDEVSLMMYQRSCDAFLGVPFNIAQYSLLTHMVAHQLGCRAREFIWVGADVHLYHNHFNQACEQIGRVPKAFPTLEFKRTPDSLFEYQYDDFKVVGYEPEGFLKGDVSLQGKPGEGVAI